MNPQSDVSSGLELVVDDAQRSHTGRGQVVRRRRSQAAGADQQDLAVEEPGLSLFADLRNAQVARVALALLAGEGSRDLDRQPGQKESRYEQLLTEPGEPQEHVTEAEEAGDRATPAPVPGLPHAVVANDLRSEFDDLKRRFEELLERLGEQID